MPDVVGKAATPLLLTAVSLLVCAAAGWLLARAFLLYTAERRRQASLNGEKSSGKAFYGCTVSALTAAFLVSCLSCSVFASNRIWAAVLGFAGAVLMLSGALTVLTAADLKKMLMGFAGGSADRFLCILGLYAHAGSAGADVLLCAVFSVWADAPALMMLWMLQDLFKGKMGKTDLNDARGFGRKKPVLHICLLSAVCSLAAIPLSAQSVIQVILHEAVQTSGKLLAEQGDTGLKVLFAGGDWFDLLFGAACAAGAIKLYICLFWSRNPGFQPGYDAMKRYAEDGQRRAFGLCLLAVALSGIAAGLIFGINTVQPGLTGFKSAALKLILGVSVYVAVIRSACMETRDKERIFVDRLPRIGGVRRSGRGEQANDG